MINLKKINKEKVNMTKKFNKYFKGDINIMSKINYIKKGAKYIIGAGVLITGLSSAVFGLTKDADDYYEIRNKDDLKEFATLVNLKQEYNAKGKLMNDIVFNESVIENGELKKESLLRNGNR